MKKLILFYNFAIGLLLTVATVLLGITLPQIWGMAHEMGELGVQQITIADTTNRIEKRLEARFDKMDLHLSGMATSMNEVRVRLHLSESDPIKILARAGVKIRGGYSAALIGNKMFVIPKHRGCRSRSYEGASVH